MRLPTLPHGMLRRIAHSHTGIWLTICSVAAACFAAACIAGLVAARSDTEQRAQAAASAATAHIAPAIALMIQRYDHAMQTVTARLQSPAMATLDETTRNIMLFDPAADIPSLGFINVLDEDGRVVESPEPAQRGAKWSGRDYFYEQRLNADLGLFVSRPFGQDKYASVALSRRLTHADGTFAGVVVASLRLSYVLDLFRQAGVGPHGSITLLHNDGTMLMRLPFDRDDIGRVNPSQLSADQRRFAVTQIAGLPLSLRVGVADADVASAVQDWIVALLLGGAILCCLSVALICVLWREAYRRDVAERDNRRKSEYLAMTSHELRAPLHSILDNADRLRIDAAMDPISSPHLAAIQSAGNHLRGVIDRVLNHLHIEARLPTPRMGHVDLDELLDQCCIIVETDTAAHGLNLRYGFKAGVPEQFVTDGDLLRQILVNLLSNAIKFTERGEVAIEVGGTSDRITIEVVDTGCGIPLPQRHKLFMHGERLGAERTAIPGYGIGLAISQRLVRCLGGDIGYRENPAGGSIFWVGLPAGSLPESATFGSAGPTQFVPVMRLGTIEQHLVDSDGVA
jgi:signal transduction histidine kinase